MQDYSDQVLTINDLSEDETGSSFTNCTFEPGGEGAPIEGIDFSFALFTGCTWNVNVIDSRFRSAEGDLPPVAEVTFVNPPAEGELFDDANSRLFKGDGVTTLFEVQRIDESALRTGIEINGYTPDDYSVVMGRADHDVVLESGPVTRAEYLSHAVLELTTDAADTADPVNGIPDIAADGVSSCTIFVKKKDRAGNYLTDAADDDTVDIECSRGKLSVLRTALVNGEASLTLTSVAETCISDVKAKAEGMDPATVQIQFAP